MSEIYNALVKEYPHIYLPLMKIPRRVDHPGDEPKRPKELTHQHISLSVSDSSKEIFAKIRSIVGERAEIKEDSFHIYKEVIGTKTRVDPYDSSTYEANVYGENDGSMHIRLGVVNGSFSEETRAYKKQLDLWSNKLDIRKGRDAEIKHAKAYNQSLINNARQEHREDWIMMGRYIKGKNQPEFLEQKRAKLQAELERINERLGE